ncbi:hypothetical protein TrST_g12751 [Triparma strigata]|uniref:Uncharacterized protein n=1 Tax=Triparma strigata TaxID=1606541 RepID=A0A9W7C116_9STRA|nr:hypothetical protein TrST_g12751 [Triparma strigata]
MDAAELITSPGSAPSGRRPHSLSALEDSSHPSHPSLQDTMMTTTTEEEWEHQEHQLYPLWRQTPTHKPMMFSPVTFISTSRATHSDVMSISNTTRVSRLPKNMNSSGVRARLPYSETAAFKQLPRGIDPKHMTPNEKQQEMKTRARINRELHEEQRLFMGRLKVEREGRTRIESAAAIQIQKIVRGFMARPKSDYVTQFKKTKAAKRQLMNNRSNLTADLLEMTETVGLKPIPGLTLNSRKMMEMEARKKEAQLLARKELATVQIQALFRSRAGKKRMNLIRNHALTKKRTSASTKIQSFLRGCEGRMRVKALIRKEQEEAITRIQARIRLKRGRLETDERRRKIHQSKRRNEAAVTVQRQYRGKLSRRKVICGSYAKRMTSSNDEFHRVQRMYRSMQNLEMDYASLDIEDEDAEHDEKKDYVFQRTRTLKSRENKPEGMDSPVKGSQRKTFAF